MWVSVKQHALLFLMDKLISSSCLEVQIVFKNPCDKAFYLRGTNQ